MLGLDPLPSLWAAVMSRLCGVQLDASAPVDHIVPRWLWGARPVGSTRRWRRVRLYVLGRDGWRCQLPVDAADAYDRAADAAAHRLDDDGMPVGRPLPADPDHPTNLRAACALHNWQRGDGRAAPTAGRRAGSTRWEW